MGPRPTSATSLPRKARVSKPQQSNKTGGSPERHNLTTL